MQDYTDRRVRTLSAMISTGVTSNPSSWPKTAFNRKAFTPQVPQSQMSFGLMPDNTKERSAQQFVNSLGTFVTYVNDHMCKKHGYYCDHSARKAFQRFGDTLLECPADVLMPGLHDSPIYGENMEAILDFALTMHPSEVCKDGPANDNMRQMVSWTNEMIKKNLSILASIATCTDSDPAHPYVWVTHGLAGDLQVRRGRTNEQQVMEDKYRRKHADSMYVAALTDASQATNPQTQIRMELSSTDLPGWALQCMWKDIIADLMARKQQSEANSRLFEKQMQMTQDDQGMNITCLAGVSFFAWMSPESYGLAMPDLMANFCNAFLYTCIHHLKYTNPMQTFVEWNGEDFNSSLYEMLTPTHKVGVTTGQDGQPCTNLSPFNHYKPELWDKLRSFVDDDTSKHTQRAGMYSRHFNRMWQLAQALSPGSANASAFHMFWDKCFNTEKYATQAVIPPVGVYNHRDYALFICDLLVVIAQAAYVKDGNPPLSETNSKIRRDSLLVQDGVARVISKHIMEFIMKTPQGKAYHESVTALIKPGLGVMQDEKYLKFVDGQYDEREEAEMAQADQVKALEQYAAQRQANITSEPITSAPPVRKQSKGQWLAGLGGVKLVQLTEVACEVLNDMMDDQDVLKLDIRFTPTALARLNNQDLYGQQQIQVDKMHYTDMIRQLEYNAANKEHVMCLESAMGAFRKIWTSTHRQIAHEQQSFGATDPSPNFDLMKPNTVSRAYKLMILSQQVVVPLMCKYVLLALFKTKQSPDQARIYDDILFRSEELSMENKLVTDEYWLKMMVLVDVMHGRHAGDVPSEVRAVMDTARRVFDIEKIELEAGLQPDELTDDKASIPAKKGLLAFSKLKTALRNPDKARDIKLAIESWRVRTDTSTDMTDLFDAIESLREQHFSSSATQALHWKQIGANEPHDYESIIPTASAVVRLFHRLLAMFHASIPCHKPTKEKFSMMYYLRGNGGNHSLARQAMQQRFGTLLQTGKEHGLRNVEAFGDDYEETLNEIETNTLRPVFSKQICLLWANVWRIVVVLEALAAPAVALSKNRTKFYSPKELQAELVRNIHSCQIQCRDFLRNVDDFAQRQTVDEVQLDAGVDFGLLMMGNTRNPDLRESIVTKVLGVSEEAVFDHDSVSYRQPKHYDALLRAKWARSHMEQHSSGLRSLIPRQKDTHMQSDGAHKIGFGDDFTTYSNVPNRFGSDGHTFLDKAEALQDADDLKWMLAIAKLIDPVGTRYNKQYEPIPDAGASTPDEKDMLKRLKQERGLQYLYGLDDNELKEYGKVQALITKMLQQYKKDHLMYSPDPKESWKQKTGVYCLETTMDLSQQMKDLYSAMYETNQPMTHLASVLAILVAYKMQLLPSNPSNRNLATTTEHNTIHEAAYLNLPPNEQTSEMTKWKTFVAKAGKVCFCIAIARLSAILTQCTCAPNLANLKPLLDFLTYLDKIKDISTYVGAVQAFSVMECGWQVKHTLKDSQPIYEGITAVICSTTVECIRRLINARLEVTPKGGSTVKDLLSSCTDKHNEQYMKYQVGDLTPTGIAIRNAYNAAASAAPATVSTTNPFGAAGTNAVNFNLEREILDVKTLLQNWCLHGLGTILEKFNVTSGQGYRNVQHQFTFALRSTNALLNLTRYFNYFKKKDDHQSVFKKIFQAHMWCLYDEKIKTCIVKEDAIVAKVKLGGRFTWNASGSGVFSFGLDGAEETRFTDPNDPDAWTKWTLGERNPTPVRGVQQRARGPSGAYSGPPPPALKPKPQQERLHRDAISHAFNMMRLLAADIGFVTQYAIELLKAGQAPAMLTEVDSKKITVNELTAMYNEMKRAIDDCGKYVGYTWAQYQTEKETMQTTLVIKHGTWQKQIDDEIKTISSKTGDSHVDLAYMESGHGDTGNSNTGNKYEYTTLNQEPEYADPLELKAKSQYSDSQAGKKFLSQLYSEKKGEICREFAELKVAGALCMFLDSVPKVFTSPHSEPIGDVDDTGAGVLAKWREYYGIWLSTSKTDPQDRNTASKYAADWSEAPTYGIQDVCFLPGWKDVIIGNKKVDTNSAAGQTKTKMNRYRTKMYQTNYTAHETDKTAYIRPTIANA